MRGRGENAHGAVEGAAHEQQVAHVEVVGFDFAQACERRAENQAAAEGRSRVAGGGVIDNVGRTQSRRKPVLIGREVVARQNDRAFAVFGDDLLELGRDFIESLIPGNFFEFAAAAFALAL